jgi:hypothetical protein
LAPISSGVGSSAACLLMAAIFKQAIITASKEIPILFIDKQFVKRYEFKPTELVTGITGVENYK